MKIAIDGPAGAGKSTIAKIVADEIKFQYIDTGSMYRALALYMIENNIELDDYDLMKTKIDNIDIKIKNNKIFLNNIDVSKKIIENNISIAASEIAKYLFIRKKLVSIQREIALNGNVIMDGRDIGSHVLKDADIKIYLTADVNDRAYRRFSQLKRKGLSVNLEKVIEDIKKRDYDDMNRDISPLVVADDAILVDTTGNSLQQSVNEIKKIIMERM